jgi:predicted methyltransferase
VAKSLPLLLAASLLAATTFTPTFAAETAAFSDKIKLAMASEKRSEKDKDRDRNRMPVETLKFFGIKDDMKVLELVPGRGWYTRLLASALADKGQLYVGIGTRRIEEILPKDEVFSKVKVIAKDTKLSYNEEKHGSDAVVQAIEVTDLDAVLTFRNYHNFTVEGRMAINKGILSTLKPGGIYGVVDHTRRHMQDDNDENGRRVDPVLVIKEIEASGFEFVDYSNVHYHTDDELRYEVGRKSVSGNTDRFTLLFKKPL